MRSPSRRARLSADHLGSHSRQTIAPPRSVAHAPQTKTPHRKHGPTAPLLACVAHAGAPRLELIHAGANAPANDALEREALGPIACMLRPYALSVPAARLALAISRQRFSPRRPADEPATTAARGYAGSLLGRLPARRDPSSNEREQPGSVSLVLDHPEG
jgi:hypothetical protein